MGADVRGRLKEPGAGFVLLDLVRWRVVDVVVYWLVCTARTCSPGAMEAMHRSYGAGHVRMKLLRWQSWCCCVGDPGGTRASIKRPEVLFSGGSLVRIGALQFKFLGFSEFRFGGESDSLTFEEVEQWSVLHYWLEISGSGVSSCFCVGEKGPEQPRESIFGLFWICTRSRTWRLGLTFEAHWRSLLISAFTIAFNSEI
ncbi:hypothetical protein Taro_028361 [Colocasia esculenta]|uniref:Uncharacterized protein n=1 Tax=Colocasia esculenta TaxID=4460 RepID=A0A843VTZ8_COLES|nr:hypothetical protein [Colocasia esculenta]